MANKDINYRVNVDAGRDTGVETLRDAQRAADIFDASLKEATRSATKLEKEVADVGRGADFQKIGGGLERVLGGIGLGDAGGLLGLAGDIGDVVESLGEQGLKGVIGELNSPVGKLSAGIAAVTIGMAALSAILAETAKETNAASAAYIRRRDLAREVDTASLTSIEIEERLADARQREADALENLEGQTTILNRTFEESQQQFGDFGARIGMLALNLGGGLETLNQDVTRSEEALAQARAEIEIYTAALDSQKTALADASAAAAALFSKRLSTSMQEQADRATAVAASLGDMNKMLTDSRKAADDATAAFEKLRDSTQSAIDKIDADRNRLSDEMQKTLAAFNAEIVAAYANAEEATLAAQSRFNASRATADAAFRKEEERAYRDFRNELARIRRDLDRAEQDAIRANDILALLDARENAKEERRELKENYKQTRADRREDFADRRAAEEAALAAQIADIQRRRDAEIRAIEAERSAAQAAHEEAVREIERLRTAQLDALRAVAEARAAADAAAIDAAGRAQRAWQQVAYPGAAPASAMQAFMANAYSTGSSSTPVSPFISTPTPLPIPTPGGGGGGGGNIVFAQGAITVGDVASKEDIRDAIRQAVVPAIIQARGAAYGT